MQNHTKLYAAIIAILMATLAVSFNPTLTRAQQGEPRIQDLMVNGGFEGGFQEEFGVGYGWGGFSNGNAVVGWNYDDWNNVVASGDYAQRIEIKDALDQDRFAGIYQTVSVVPGEQYKLTVKGLVRSDEGSVSASDYGYRLQYAVDYEGGISWELLSSDAWQEFPWDEQPLAAAGEGNIDYQVQTFNTTLTATSDQMTLFIRGWKKWINNGSGVFNIDEVSLVGPAPEGFQSPVAQTAAVAEIAETATADEAIAQTDDAPAANDSDLAAAPELATEAELPAEVADAAEPDAAAAPIETDAVAEMDTAESAAPAESTENTQTTTANAPTEETVSADAAPATNTNSPAQIQVNDDSGIVVANPPANQLSGLNNVANSGDTANGQSITPLPVSGEGDDASLIYVVIIGSIVLLALFASAINATVGRRRLAK